MSALCVLATHHAQTLCMRPGLPLPCSAASPAPREDPPLVSGLCSHSLPMWVGFKVTPTGGNRIIHLQSQINTLLIFKIIDFSYFEDTYHHWFSFFFICIFIHHCLFPHIDRKLSVISLSKKLRLY